MSFSIKPNTIKYLTTSRGVAFRAALYEGKKMVGHVENEGRGGATTADVLGGHMGITYNNLEQAAKIAGHSAVEWYLDSLMDEAEDSLLKSL